MSGSFAQRIWDGYKELEKREGRVSQGELAKRIASATGRTTRQDEVSRWFREVARPEYEELPGIAYVLGVRLLWLAFGFGPMLAEKPEGFPLASKLPARVRKKVHDPDIPHAKRRGA